MAFWLVFLLWAATYAIGELMRPKDDEEEKDKGIDDPSSKEDRRIPILFGRTKIDSPNALFVGIPLEEPILLRRKTGLFTSTRDVVGYRYSVALQLGWCYGPVKDITRLWWNKDDIFYDIADGDPIINSSNSTLTKRNLNFFAGAPGSSTVPAVWDGFSLTWEWKLGTFNQTAATYYTLSGDQTINAQIPTYPGICYSMNLEFPVNLVTGGLANSYVGNSGKVPPISAEISRFPNGIGLTGTMEEVNGADANPACILYEILTNADWGLGVPAIEVDTASFVTAGTALFGEGNGYTNLIDVKEDILNLIRGVEEHMDGILFKSPTAGKWQIKLFRTDYKLLNLFAVNEDNIIEVSTFTRGTWEGTTNQVTVKFKDREDNYKETSAFSQDMANEFIVQSAVVTEKVFPGCKNRSLANKLAWRTLRTLSFPLAQGAIIVDRTASSVSPGQVLRFTNAALGITDMAIRVKEVDFGNILEGSIRIEFAEDIFYDAAPTFADPQDTTWTDPGLGDLQAIPAAEQFIIEAPRGIIMRDDGSATDDASKIFCVTRRQTAESFVFGVQATSTDGINEGAYTQEISSASFAFIGSLTVAIDPGGQYVGSIPEIQIDALPSTALDIEGSFGTIVNPDDLGTDLSQLCYIDGTNGGEFILVTSSGPGIGGDVTLNDVYRGVLDSVQQRHEAGDPVWMIFLSGTVSFSEVVNGEYAHIRLGPAAYFGNIDPQDAAVTEVAIQMTQRALRPIPPSEYKVNTVRYPSSVAFGSYLTEASSLDFEITRRDYRQVNEVEALTVDAGTLNSDYPSFNSTTHEAIIADLASVPYLSASFASGTTVSITQLDFVQVLNDSSYPSSVRLEFRALHTVSSGQLFSRDNTYRVTLLSSPLIAAFTFGARTTNIDTNNYVVTAGDAAAGVDVTISSAYTTGDVQYRINAGAWTQVIPAASTTGAILAAALATSDTLEFRTTSSETHQKGFELTQTGPNTLLGYGLFFA